MYDTCANGVLGSVENEVLGDLSASRPEIKRDARFSLLT